MLCLSPTDLQPVAVIMIVGPFPHSLPAPGKVPSPLLVPAGSFGWRWAAPRTTVPAVLILIRDMAPKVLTPASSFIIAAPLHLLLLELTKDKQARFQVKGQHTIWAISSCCSIHINAIVFLTSVACHVVVAFSPALGKFWATTVLCTFNPVDLTICSILSEVWQNSSEGSPCFHEPASSRGN